MSHEFFSSSEVKEGLQPERVALAWQRTLLAVFIVIAAGIRYSLSIPNFPKFALFVAALGLLCVAISMVLNRRRYQIMKKQMEAQQFLIAPAVQMLLIVSVLIAVGITCLAIVIFSSFGK